MDSDWNCFRSLSERIGQRGSDSVGAGVVAVVGAGAGGGAGGRRGVAVVGRTGIPLSNYCDRRRMTPAHVDRTVPEIIYRTKI